MTPPSGPSRQPGIAEWFEIGERERVERVAAGRSELGIERLHTGVSWADWHTREGERWYAWLLPRLARDLRLLPCVAWTPRSLAQAPKPSAPLRLRDYADFVDVPIAQHGRQFEYVELWNGPNGIADPDPRLDLEWTKLAELIAAAARRARRRGRRTVLGGRCPLDPRWLGVMAAKGALDHVDVLGIHRFPDTWEAASPGWPDVVGAAREVLEDHEVDARIWITEAGYSTWRRHEYGQVRELVEAVESDVRRDHMGLRRNDGRPKLLARLLAEGGMPLVREIDRTARRPARWAPVTLVTGGAGFIGTNVADRLLSAGRRVRLYDNLSRPGVEQNLRWLVDTHDEAVEVVVGDLRDRVALREALGGVSQVFHLGAQVAVTTSVADPELDFGSNVQGTVFLLEELRRLGPDPPPLLFTSTNKVYGMLPDLELERIDDRWEPMDPAVRAAGLCERRPLDFSTPYGCSKGAADQYVLDYAETFGFPAVVFRMSCIYGPHQHGNEDQGWVAYFLLRALAEEPITIFGDGAQVRDVLFVDDLVDAMLLALDDVERLAGTAFNMGGGVENSLSLLEFVDLVEDVTGGLPEIVFGPERIGDQRYYVADASRFAAATGWSPRVGAREGIAFLHRWLAERRSPRQIRVAAR